MPTRADFEAAAEKFQSASAQVGELAAGADSAAAARVLQGGVLGRQVPARLASSSATALACQGLIDTAAETCIERAGIIADYEVRLELYDTARESYTQAVNHYRNALDRWWLDETGTVDHPGDPPVKPEKPAPPPDWAEVRRP